MRIEINEAGSPAFYRETVNAAAQYRYLLKNHNYKLKDYFKQFRTLLIAGAAVFALNIVLIVLWGADTLRLTTAAALLIAMLLSCAYLFSLSKAYKSMLENAHASVLKLDESGVELDVADTQTVKIARNNVAVIRIFSESLCFVPQTGAGVIIAVAKDKAAQIPEWVRENWPEAEIV